MPFLRLTTFVIFGIYLVEKFELNFTILLSCLGIISLSYLLLSLLNRAFIRKINVFYVAFFFALIGAFAQKQSNIKFDRSHFSHYISEHDKVVGKVNSVKHGFYSKYILSVDQICNDNECQKSSGKLLVKSKNDSFRKGDKVLISSPIDTFLKQKNQFAFEKKFYFKNKKVYHHTFADEMHLVSASASRIGRYRENLHEKIDDLLVSASAKSVLLAMLIGDKSELGELEGVFRKTGTSHVLAISGLHVGIIATIIFYLLSFMPSSADKLKYAIVVVLIWLFCFLSGAMPSTVRSCIMLTCFLFGKSIGRNGLSYNYCFAAAFFMLLQQPGLIYDVGFQFSFSAIIGILYFYEPIYKALQFRGVWNYCWQLIAMSMAAQLMITPLSLYYFHEFPILFLLTSLVAIPCTFIIIAFSLITILLSHPFFEFLMLEKLLSWFIETFLSLLGIFAANDSLVLVNLFPDKIEVFLYYTLVFSLTIFFRQQIQKLLYLFAISFLLLTSYQFKVNNELSKSHMIIYADPSDIMIDYIHAGTVTHFYEHGQRPTKVEWIAKNQRIKLQVSKRQNIEISINKNQVLEAGNNKIGILNTNEPLTQELLKSDILLVNAGIDQCILKSFKNTIIDFEGNNIPGAKSNQQIIQSIKFSL